MLRWDYDNPPTVTLLQQINDQGIAVKKHNYICMYNDVPTTCFGLYLTGHHQVGIQCQRNYILTINKLIHVFPTPVQPHALYFVNQILSPPPPLFCTHTNTDVYTYSRYIVPLALYSDLMMASQVTAETCSWYVIVHTNIVVFFDCYSLIIDLLQF